MTVQPLRALLFDKDGTLFDFRATWDGWGAQILRHLSQGNATVLNGMAEAIGFDLIKGQFHPSSIAVAGTNREAVQCLLPFLPDWTLPRLETFLSEAAAEAPMAETVPLRGFFQGLATNGFALGVMTNDSEIGARAHLSSVDALDPLDFVAGYDSGFGAKPSPDPLLAFADAMGLMPAHVAMVGDSTHDLLAGRAAGMVTVAVLTGLATAEELAPLADVVLPDIGHLPEWIDQRTAV